MENSLMKSNLRRLDFPNQTPQRAETRTTDFYSSQKAKYEPQQKPSHNTSLNYLSLAEAYNAQKEIYENQVPIRIKSHDREEFQSFLNIKLSLLAPSPSHSSVLHIELTDETNHLFLYVLDISEGDFLTLKNEQQLVFDFQAFPSKLIELLEITLNPQRDEKIQFYCVLDVKSTNEAFLNIVELNGFKSLCHFSLKFREATDTILKTYLAHRLSNEKNSNEDLRIKVERLEEALSHKVSDLERHQVELRRFQEEKERQINELMNEERKKLNESKEQALEKETTLVRSAEQEKKELTTHYEKTVKDLQTKLEQLIRNNQDLTEIRIGLEARERELNGKVRTYERENELMQKEIENIRGNNKELDTMRFGNEKSLAEYRVRVESLEAQLRNKEEVIAKQTELLNNAGNQKALLDENIAEYKKKIEKLENKCNLCTEEINKGNEIIEKLQNDLSQQKQKVKLKNSMVIQQEETLTKNSEILDKLNKQITELQREMNNKEFVIKDLDNTVEDLKNKLTESQKVIESNQQMIAWLNKCLNEQQRPGGIRVPFTNKFTATPGASGNQSTAYSPYKAYGGDNDMGVSGNSMKYSTSVNVDKYKPYQPIDQNTLFSGTNTNPLTFSKTLGGTLGGTQFTAEFEKGGESFTNFNKVSTLSNIYEGVKENMDYTNRSMTSLNPLTTNKTHLGGNEFTSTSSIDISAYGRGGIQPIKYQDPNK